MQKLQVQQQNKTNTFISVIIFDFLHVFCVDKAHRIIVK